MKYILIIIFSTCLIYTHTAAQTQAQLNKEASDFYKKSDMELNSVYKQIIEEYSNDAIFIEALRTSQRNWITFRDSELKMKYPNREPGWYGSIQTMCVSYYMAELTNERTRRLRLWVDGIDEGDACAGTIKTKD